MTSVTVVMATYNGAAYLGEQLASLAAQTRRPDCVVLRDDGSGDQSVALARDWAQGSGIPLHLLPAGERLGPARAFLLALQQAPGADIYLFCDQDDIWLPHKIARAEQVLCQAGHQQPHLLATRQWVVDAALQNRRLSAMPRHLSFNSAVCESVLTGCTMAINRPLRDLLVRELPRQIGMHDWWCYLVASGTGQVSFDPDPSMMYRQHASNLLGAADRGWARHRERLLRFVRRPSRIRSRQLQEFARLHLADASPPAARLTQALLRAQDGAWARWQAALSAPLRRQSGFSEWATRLSLLTGRF